MVIWCERRFQCKLIATTFVIASILVAIPASGNAAAPPQTEEDDFDTMVLPPEALDGPIDLTGAMRSAEQTKLDSSMSRLVVAAEKSTAAAAIYADAQSLRISDSRVSVQISIHAPSLEDVVGTVTELGGEVTSVGYDDSLIQAWVPVDALEILAKDDNVYYIRRPQEAILLDTPDLVDATTEGLAVMNAPAWHSAGHTGSGVKVGIIDGGFTGYADLLGTDLPAVVQVSNLVDGESSSEVDGTTPHGTAVAEIIHDIAPDAELFLAKISTQLDLEQAVNWLKDTHGVDVISTSIGWYSLTPGDGTGFFADLVADARSSDILWATAAGNDREKHWGGSYVDSNGDDLHEFNGQLVNMFGPGGGLCYMINSGYALPVFLRWNDWTNVDQDYALFIVRYDFDNSTWTSIAAGLDVQDGSPGQAPTESAYGVSVGTATCYGFVITRVDATVDVHFEAFAASMPHIDQVVNERSLVDLADAPDAMTVAALDVTSPYPQESYSSEGPTNGPGGAATGGILKPDIAAFANVATESYPGSTFGGTSSATPHVAGAAALILSAYPSYTANQVQSLLEGRSIDMGSAGHDTDFGHGRLYLGDPPPEIAVWPTSLVAGQESNSQTSTTLTISNLGPEPLTWSIGESENNVSAAASLRSHNEVNAPEIHAAACDSLIDLPWISLSPTSGTTLSGTDTDVTVTFDSTGLPPGPYSGTVCIASNDPAMPLLTVQSGLTVETTVAISLGFFSAEQDGKIVNFVWQTATESGVAGFNILAETEAGKIRLNRIQINDELIPSSVIDSVSPTDYSFSATTEATAFYLQEIDLNGNSTDYGAFSLGVEYGTASSTVPTGLTPSLWLPMIER